MKRDTNLITEILLYVQDYGNDVSKMSNFTQRKEQILEHMWIAWKENLVYAENVSAIDKGNEVVITRGLTPAGHTFISQNKGWAITQKLSHPITLAVSGAVIGAVVTFLFTQF